MIGSRALIQYEKIDLALFHDARPNPETGARPPGKEEGTLDPEFSRPSYRSTRRGQLDLLLRGGGSMPG